MVSVDKMKRSGGGSVSSGPTSRIPRVGPPESGSREPGGGKRRALSAGCGVTSRTCPTASAIGPAVCGSVTRGVVVAGSGQRRGEADMEPASRSAVRSGGWVTETSIALNVGAGLDEPAPACGDSAAPRSAWLPCGRIEQWYRVSRRPCPGSCRRRDICRCLRSMTVRRPAGSGAARQAPNPRSWPQRPTLHPAA